MNKNSPCVHCGMNIVKNGRNPDGSQKYLCRGCGTTKPLDKNHRPVKYAFRVIDDKISSERLTEEQRKTMNDFKAVHNGEMTMHELLEK